MTQHLGSNPFALLTDPAAVIAAMECSARLSHLNSRICRPLDKPVLPLVGDEEAEPDNSIDADADAAESDPAQ